MLNVYRGKVIKCFYFAIFYLNDCNGVSKTLYITTFITFDDVRIKYQVKFE